MTPPTDPMTRLVILIVVALIVLIILDFITHNDEDPPAGTSRPSSDPLLTLCL